MKIPKDVSAAQKKREKYELEDVVDECNAISQEWLRKHRISMTELIHEHPHRNPQELQIEYLEAKVCTVLSIILMMGTTKKSPFYWIACLHPKPIHPWTKYE